MGMNIKNEEAHRLARELAQATGQSLTAAVTEALRLRLESVRAKQNKPGRYERLMAIARDCAARIPPDQHSLDHGELLYEEMGLPK